MPKQVIEYRCLLMSPSDVVPEREAITSLVVSWNAQIGIGLGARLELVRWESHATPDLSDTAQNVINRDLVEDCDLGVAVFWSRLGTPTKEHPSGSVEEIYRLLRRKARVMVYFSDAPIPQNALRDDQYHRLQEIKTQFQSEGLLSNYSGIPHLREQVNLHLTNIVTQMLTRDRDASSVIPSSGTLTAPTPDIRVSVRYGFVKRGNIVDDLIVITVGKPFSAYRLYCSNLF